MATTFTLHVLLLLIYVPTICWTGRANTLGVSKESLFEPHLIWPVQTTKHGTSEPGKRYAVLHSVSFGTGPTTNTGTLNSFVFGGTSDSYVEMDNTDGGLNGQDAMCWAFYVKFPSGAPEAVLLQYFGSDGTKGLQLLLQTNGKLRADFYDETGQQYTCTSAFDLSPDTWYLVGMNFNTLWDTDDQFDIFYFESENNVIKETIGLGRSDPLLDTEGTVRLGAARDGTSPFNGEISCVQFYTTSLIKSAQTSIYDLCDPSLMASDFGEHTMDFIATTTTTTPPPPTTTTTPTTTTQPTTTPPPPTTTTTSPTTPTATTTTTTPTTTTTTTPTTTIPPTTTTPTTTIPPTTTTPTTTTPTKSPVLQPPIDNCVRFTKTSVDETFLSPLVTTVVTSASRCATLCHMNSDCRSISIKGSEPNIACGLGTNGAATNPDTGAVIFELS